LHAPLFCNANRGLVKGKLLQFRRSIRGDVIDFSMARKNYQSALSQRPLRS